MCSEYHKIANNLHKHSDLDVRNVTHLSDDRPQEAINYTSGANDYLQQKDCPTVASLNLQTNDTNESAFSPWKYVINRDFNR